MVAASDNLFSCVVQQYLLALPALPDRMLTGFLIGRVLTVSLSSSLSPFQNSERERVSVLEIVLYTLCEVRVP